MTRDAWTRTGRKGRRVNSRPPCGCVDESGSESRVSVRTGVGVQSHRRTPVCVHTHPPPYPQFVWLWSKLRNSKTLSETVDPRRSLLIYTHHRHRGHTQTKTVTRTRRTPDTTKDSQTDIGTVSPPPCPRGGTQTVSPPYRRGKKGEGVAVLVLDRNRVKDPCRSGSSPTSSAEPSVETTREESRLSSGSRVTRNRDPRCRKRGFRDGTKVKGLVASPRCLPVPVVMSHVLRSRVRQLSTGTGERALCRRDGPLLRNT